MSTTTTFIPASARQAEFIRTLLAERTVDATLAASTLRELDEGKLAKSSASIVIDRLLKLPKTPRAAAASRASSADFSGVPCSRYAIPAEEVEALPIDVSLHGDLLFVEIKTYQGTTYMRRLIGAPGAFSRLRMSASAVEELLSVLRDDPYRYARLFGENYSCCGKCGAELTDDESRRLMLGPVCRRAFGL